MPSILTRSVHRIWSRLAAAELASAAAWSAAGEMIFRGTALVTTAIVARLLGAADFGLFGLIRNGVAQFGGLGSAGLGLTANRYLPVYRRNEPAEAGAVIGTSLGLSATGGFVLAVIGYVASGWIAQRLLGDANLKGPVQLGVVLVAIAGVSGAQLGIIQGLEAFRSLAMTYLVAGIIGGTALVAGAYAFGLTGALAGLATTSAVTLLLFQVLIYREAARQGIRLLWWQWRPIAPVLVSFTLPAALMTLAVGPLRWLAESLLAKSAGFSEAGIFYAAMLVFSLVVGLVMTLHSPLMSLLARRTAEGRPGRLPWISLYASWFAFLIVALPFLALPSVPARLFGPEYQPDVFARVILLVLLYCGLQCYAQGLSRAIVQSGSMWFQLFLSVVEGVSLIAAFLALSGHGAIGLALASVASYVTRIAFTIPVLARRRLIEPTLLADRRFLASAGLFLAAILLQWHLIE